MTAEQRTADQQLGYEDGSIELEDGRVLAWRWWGDPGWIPVLRLQGTPGSRLYRHPDPNLQRELGVRYLMADRPGYGGSTRKPNRGFVDFASDLEALLDSHGLDRVPVMGTSGGGPHALAVAAALRDRLSGVSVIVGAAPLEPDEVNRLVGVNAQGWAAARKGWSAMHELLVEVREQVLSPAGLAGVLHDVPETDRIVMSDPRWREMSRANNAEALRQGAEGWADEAMALQADWDFRPEDVGASVTWWHGDDDMNAPLSAARRAAERLPSVDMRIWHGEGHFASLVHEREIVEELLSRARA